MMRSDEAADRLRELLVEAGVDVERPAHADVGLTWDVMRRFALELAEDVPAEPGGYDDGLFAEYGIFDWTFTGEHEHFELGMSRQFAVPAPGQPVLRQVRCTFTFAPTAQLRELGEAGLDSFEIGVDAFFAKALAMPGFAGVRENGATSIALSISWTDV